MSDFEEPAAKISKLETPAREHEEELDEGHEEWLSEGILTDDDYNPAAENEATPNTSQENGEDLNNKADAHDGLENTSNGNRTENIEQKLDDLENSKVKETVTELPGSLGAFLIRKTDSKDSKVADEKREESELDESTKQSDDDGHDTDDLLRMLGEDSKKVAKKDERKQNQESQSSDDDDEYIFEGAKISRLKVAKSVLMNRQPRRALPEDMSDKEQDTDMSSDEAVTVKRMFAAKGSRGNFASKSTAKPPISSAKAVTARIVNVARNDKPPATSTPLPRSQPKQLDTERREPAVVMDELYEDEDELDEDLASESSGGLRLMRPERMDEEAPSDQDSQSDNDSLYDELPSSDSEDSNEWFSLDVRQERAGDYIPLLGAKAHQLLLQEKQRVSTRLSALKQSVTTLSESSLQQAEMLRRATLQLAELDAALKA